MAKSKVRKPHPKPPADVKSVIALKKVIDERKAKLVKRKETATKDGKLNRYDPKFRVALKRVKRAQRKLKTEGYRLQPSKSGIKAAAPVAAAPVEAAKE